MVGAGEHGGCYSDRIRDSRGPKRGVRRYNRGTLEPIEFGVMRGSRVSLEFGHLVETEPTEARSTAGVWAEGLWSASSILESVGCQGPRAVRVMMQSSGAARMGLWTKSIYYPFD